MFYCKKACPNCGNMNLWHCSDGQWNYDRCGLCGWESDRWRYTVSDNSGRGQDIYGGTDQCNH